MFWGIRLRTTSITRHVRLPKHSFTEFLLASLACKLSCSKPDCLCWEQDYKMHKSHKLASGMSAVCNTRLQGCSCSVGLPRQDLGVEAHGAPGAPHGARAGVLP